MRSAWGWIVGPLLAITVVAGACSSGGGDEVASDVAESSELSDARSGAAGEAEFSDDSGSGGVGAPATAGDQDTGGSGGALPDLVPDLGRHIVKTATLRIEVDSFRDAFSEAVSVAETHGGFVEASTAQSASDDQDHGALTIRVPAERFDGARRALAQLGDVDHEHVTGEDVTDQLTDIGARLRNLQAQEAAVLQLMSRATNIAETMQVQQQLFSLREQIERLAAQQAQLERASALATIRVNLAETGVPAKARESAGNSGLANAFERAADGAVSVVAAVIIGLGYLLPIALIVASVAAAWWLARRRGTERPAAT